MTQAKQGKREKFKWSWLKPARNAFFVFYTLCLISASILIRRQFLNPVLDPTRETLDEIFGSSAYLPESNVLEIGSEKIQFWRPVSSGKITAFRMMIREQSSPYSFIAAVDDESRIAQIRKIRMPELIPKILFPDEELFLLSLEGRRVDDFPAVEGEGTFKARFLSKLKIIMTAHSDHNEQTTNSDLKNEKV